MDTNRSPEWTWWAAAAITVGILTAVLGPTTQMLVEMWGDEFGWRAPSWLGYPVIAALSSGAAWYDRWERKASLEARVLAVA